MPTLMVSISGIRGIIGDGLDPETIVKYTNAYGDFVGSGKIVIGRDGLIAERGGRRGLLLPQVPIDHDRNWDVETFLSHTCMKAWLPDDAWKSMDTKIYSFQAILFEEKEPKGDIVRKYLK